MPITEARCDFRSARRPRIASTKACGGFAGHSIALRSDDTFRMSSTLSEKVWERHVVRRAGEEPDLLYVDLHLVHEVTSPQAFEGLRLSKRRVRRPDLTLAVTVEGVLPADCAAKDVILGIIARIGTAGGTGKVIEYRGTAIRALSIEGRLTICNMSIEAGARAGMVAPDDVTFAWLEGRPFAPKGALWENALDDWRSLATDAGASFDREITIDASTLRPYVTWGTNPAQSVTIDGAVPDPDRLPADARESARRALRYQELVPGTPVREIVVDAVFIGSCTNARLEDLRLASEVVRGRKVRSGLRALVVPGSMRVKADAEREGLDRIFREAGFEWRDAGCSMCLGMNPDVLRPGERCASTSNRNFEGRQGPGGRTHLVSPAVAAATAIAGHFALPADL